MNFGGSTLQPVSVMIGKPENFLKSQELKTPKITAEVKEVSSLTPTLVV